MAVYFTEAGIRPKAVLCSDARRTRETLDLVRSALPNEAAVSIDDTLYLADANALLRTIHAIGDSVRSALIIAHEPGLSDLSLILAGRDRNGECRRIQRKFPTAALAVLVFNAPSWRGVAPRSGELIGFTAPKTLGGL